MADAQVHRDHLLSHLLAAISQHASNDVLFFGGTALSRTHLPDLRLSEDLDLVSLQPRAQVARLLGTALPAALAPSHGRVTRKPDLSQVRDTQPATLATADGLTVRIQLLSREGIARWPTERRPLIQRYDDAPPAELLVPTRSAFSAWKTVAWADRRAARDLYDVWALARLGAIDDDAVEAYVRFGPTGRPPADHVFERALTEHAWSLQLTEQTIIATSSEAALDEVRGAWMAARTRY